MTCEEGGRSDIEAYRTVERLHASLGLPADVRQLSDQEGFRALVDTLYSAFSKRKSSQSPATHPLEGIDPHFAPITTLCLLQAGFVYDYVLKLEAIDDWYADFLELSGLQAEAASGWHIDSWLNVVSDPAEPCFYRPKGASCADVAVSSSYFSAPCGGPSGRLEVGPQGEQQRPLQRSSNQSEALIRSFYDADLAAKVTDMYSEDLRMLGYAPWGGETDYDPLQAT